jgi:cyclic pyranopterin phosphate synthase
MAYTLRVSVLDTCQLRCGYCLPNGPKNILRRREWLSLKEYKKIAQALKSLGLEKIRYTGGEPLLHPDLPNIIKVFTQEFPAIEHALTTNGQAFSSMAESLVHAGLTGVTFHLDTLRSERYASIMGRGEVGVVFAALKQAQDLGLNVKINMVAQKNINDDELGDFLHFSAQQKIEVRFIELMNTGSAEAFVERAFLSGQHILEKIQQYSLVVPLGRQNPHAAAEQFLAKQMGVVFGLIASDTRPFCEHCNRLRLSADGRLRTCLYEPKGQKLNVKESPDELVKALKMMASIKTSFHPLSRKKREDFSMAQIGG